MKKKILALVLSITLAVSPIVSVQAEEQQETVDITEQEVQTEEIHQDALEGDVSMEEDQNDTSSEPEQTDGVQNDILADDAETAEVQESETSEVNLSNITVGGYIETVTLCSDLVVICNEEGRLKRLPHCCEICGVDFVGPVILCGVKKDRFTDLPVDWKALKKLFPGLWEVKQ